MEVYEISILWEIQNSTGQALISLIQLVMLSAEVRPDVTSRGPFQCKWCCDSIYLQLWSFLWSSTEVVHCLQGGWVGVSAHQRNGQSLRNVTDILEQFWILRQKQGQSIIFSHPVFIAFCQILSTNKTLVVFIISHSIYTDRSKFSSQYFNYHNKKKISKWTWFWNTSFLPSPIYLSSLG